VLHDACAAIGRDPAEITCSVIARFEGDVGALGRDVEAWQSVGADLVIVSVPKSAPPSIIEDIAGAVSAHS
jgi:hypothetical protein